MERSPFIDPPPGEVAEKTVDDTINDTTACVTTPGDTSPVDDTPASIQRKRWPRYLLLSLAAVVGAFVVFVLMANLPTRLWMPAEVATLAYLAETTLQNISSGEKFKDAKELSSLKSDLDACDIGLYAVVHETFDVPGYQPYFAGEVYYDAERRFYGPKERRMYISGIFRPGVWKAKSRASDNGVEGNSKGSGSLLGGLFVIGPGKEGILLEHRESEWGDGADLGEVLEAVHRIKACPGPDTVSTGETSG